VRTYTVRSLDLEAGTFDVDFVLHGDHGVGSRWALNTRPGDVIGVRGPTGRRLPEADWYLLVGDETALPIIGRTLESLPAKAKGIAFIEVADESEQQPLRYDADIELRWLHRDGAEPGTTNLLIDAVRAVEMPPAGTRIHAVAGVEYAAFKAIRRYWRDELKLNKKDVLPVAYWRKGHAAGEAADDDEEDRAP
jgi:NADPH-dependent ferric siderophore reductase